MPLIDSRPVPLRSLTGISAEEAKALKNAGIRNTQQLLDAAGTPAAVKALARQAGLQVGRVREAVSRADLVRLDGVGPAMADLFENVGVQSLNELSQRRADALARTARTYAEQHPDQGYRAPSQNAMQVLINRAQQVTGTRPTDQVRNLDQAVAWGTDALKGYLSSILFGVHPEGQPFRDAILAHRTLDERAAFRQRMLDELPAYFASADKSEDSTSFAFSGAWVGLHTEITVRKAGGVAHLLVEID